MKKILAIGVLTLGFGSVAIAEENGAFVGIEAGFANGYASAEAKINGQRLKQSGKLDHYGFKAGYKYFFQQNVGIRAYGALNNGSYTSIYTNSLDSTRNTDDEVSFMTITANADFLFNVYSADNTDVGLFAGVGLGMINGKYKEIGLSESPTGLYVDAKIGARINAAKNHGMDFIVKIPFTEATKNINVNGVNADLTIKQEMAISIGYNYSFSVL